MKRSEEVEEESGETSDVWRGKEEERKTGIGRLG